jgi:hypothetical protein
MLPDAADFEVMWKMAVIFFNSGLMPSGVRSTEATFLIIQKGRELGIPATEALSKIAVISGKPVCGGELILGLIKSRVGADAVIVEESDSEKCTVSYARPGWDKRRSFTFTMDDARKAGLAGKDIWKQYPANMLRWRCVSIVGRMEFADVIGGLYVAEELGATIDGETGEIIDIPASAPQQMKTVTQQATQAAQTSQQVEMDGPILQATMNALHAQAASLGIDHDDLHTATFAIFGIGSMKDLTERQGRRLGRLMRDGEVTKAQIDAHRTERFGAQPEEDVAPPVDEPPADQAPQPAQRVSLAALARLGKAAEERGLDDTALINIAGTRYGVEALNELSPSDAQDFIDHVRANYDKVSG